ncbi:MAG: hypothetical protein HYX78_07910 [Armatimonadetes bacterium]|nr:hypothetical protein [Armatimonadota bacterium]
MLRRQISLFLVVIAVILATAVDAGSAPGVTKEDLKGIMPISEVRTGMKGYGLTVFRGTKIEKFDVEVLGILRKANNGKDLIFARLSGGPITERGANIIQGMSGSPVYINGRMIGAVAYGPGGFSKEPLGMLTPIEDMLDALDPKLPAHPPGLSSAASTVLGSPVKVGNETIRRVEIRTPISGSGRAASGGTFVMTPLMTPLMVSGMSSRGIAQLAELLEPYGIMPMAGPGARADDIPTELKPGASVGLSLATGDIDLTAVGTVTYRRGNKIVGFGHPMLNIGPIDAPMTTAYVHDVFPSLQISSKIASPMKVVGRIAQDRPWSIGGEIGEMPKMIPVTVDVDDVAIGRKRTIKVNVLNHPLLAPKLVVMMTAEALAQTHGLPGDAMAKVKLEIDADQVGKIIRENEFFDTTSIEGASIDDLMGLVNILSNNRFHPVDIKAVHMSVRIDSGRKTADIERIFVDKSKYEPGETIDVGVELRPYKSKDTTVRTIQVRIPETAPDGTLPLQVRGGMMSGMAEGQVVVVAGGAQAPKIVAAPSSSAENIRQIIDKYLEGEKNNELVARLILPTAAISIAGEKLSGLPDSIAGVMKTSKSSSVKLEREDVKTVQPTEYVLSGIQMLSIRVERRRLGEKKQPSRPQPSPPQMPAGAGTVPPPTNVQIEQEDSDEIIEDYATSLPVEFASAPQAGAVNAQQPSQAKSQPQQPKPAAAAKTDSKQAAKPAQNGETPVGRQPTVWKQSKFQEFSLGTFDGTAASSTDDVRLSAAIEKLSDLPENYVWQAVSDGQGGVYAATGSIGLIYKIDGEGSNSVFFKTGELEVHSLARDSKGTIYAGTSPNGKIYRITPDGKGSVAFDAEEKYIVALAADSKDNIYAGAGDGGVIYRIAPDSSADEFIRLREASILSLAVDGSDNLYAGTAKNGIVYKITPDGIVSALYNAAEDSVTSIAVDSAGNVYAGTGSGKGNIYKISVTGAPEVVFDKAPKALSMAADRSDNVYVVSDEQIFKITPDEAVMSLDTGMSRVQFIAVAVAADGSLFAGAANTAAVYRSLGKQAGSYESPVHDASLPARWGRISWIAETPEGITVTLQTRTGNAAEPDATWSGWSSAYSGGAGEQITSPPGRYIQYRATVNGAGNARLKQVSIAYLTENRPPKLKVTAPEPAAVVARTQAIKWTGTDPDKDKLIYDLYYSADSGKTWQPLGSVLKQNNNGSGAAAEPEKKDAESEQPAQEEPEEQEPADTGEPDAEELMAQIKSELDQHPEIPQDVKDKMLAEAPTAIDKAVAAASNPPPDPPENKSGSNNGETNSTKLTSHNWDTTKVPDGSYLIKVVASDRISNATGPLSDEQIVGPVTVANKPPRVAAFEKEMKIDSDGKIVLKGYAYHMQVPIAGVQYKIGSAEWMSAAASDGMFDSASEAFTISTQPLSKGKHTIEVKAIDAAGNAATEKVTANVP